MKASPSVRISLLSVIALNAYILAANVLTFPITKRITSGFPGQQLWKREALSESLVNNVTFYQANVSIGTPPQHFSLLIDTGSSDVILIAINADQCTNQVIEFEYGGCYGGLFDPTKSSTVEIVPNGYFDIQYGDGTESSGNYITDDFTIGGTVVKNLQMGLTNTTTSGVGVIGIGYNINEASMTSFTSVPYPNLVDQMVSQGLINTKSYSLYLDDLEEATGSIIFGGVDTDKFMHVEIIPVNLISLTITKIILVARYTLYLSS